MYGAVLGDIIGSPYEGGGAVAKDFPLFDEEPKFTDDTVMTVAVAEALLKFKGGLGQDSPMPEEAQELYRSGNRKDRKVIKAVTKSLRKWGLQYEWADYGAGFNLWLHTKNAEPYYSYGNGSAMRCSAAGWLGHTIEEAERLAGLSACVTHNHPEGIKGAQATAAAIYIARGSHDSVRTCKASIKDYIQDKFGYNIWKGYDMLGMTGISCQQTVPAAMICVLKADSFEEAVRLAVTLGGDTDTAAAIAGSIAEPLFGIPGEFIEKAKAVIPPKMAKILDRI